MPKRPITRLTGLEITPSSTNDETGILLDPIATAVRDAIPNISNGRLIYNGTTNNFQAYQNGVWTNLATNPAATLNAPIFATGAAPAAANGNIYYDSTTNALTIGVSGAYTSVYTSPLAQSGNLVIKSAAADPAGGNSATGEVFYNTTINAPKIRNNTAWNIINSQANFVLNRTVTAISYQALITDVLIAVTNTAAARTITLPAVATTIPGQIIIVKDESGGANTVTVDGSGAETIDGAANVVLGAGAYGVVSLYSTGTAWFSIEKRIA